MLNPSTATFSSLRLGPGLGVHHEYVAKQCHLTRSYEGDQFSKTFRGLLRFRSNNQNFFQIRGLKIRSPSRGQQHIVIPKCAAEEISDIKHKEEEEISRALLIWRAIKLPMYSVALVPVTVGAAVAYMQTGVFSVNRYLTLLASYCLVLAWINLSNDVYDFDTGADKDKKESVVNLFGSRAVPFIGSYLLLGLGFMMSARVAADAGNMSSLIPLLCSIACSYMYQCPPFRLSYLGVGEPLLFATFGPFATIAYYLLFGNTRDITLNPFNGTIVAASTLVGWTTALILFCSHFHQIEGDLAVGKMSPLVRLGTEKGAVVVKWAVLGLYSLLFGLGLFKAIPLTCVAFGALTAPMGKLVVDFVEENHKDNGKIFMGKYFCVRLHTLLGAALTAGLVTAKMLAK